MKGDGGGTFGVTEHSCVWSVKIQGVVHGTGFGSFLITSLVGCHSNHCCCVLFEVCAEAEVKVEAQT